MHHYKLSTSLIQHLNNRHIYTLAQAALPDVPGFTQRWIDANQLGLSGDLATEWNNFLLILKSSGITLNNTNDKIVWSWNKAMGTITANLAYQSISNNYHKERTRWWFKSIWKVNIPSKITCFMWLCLKDCIITGANYRKQGGIGPSVCSLCLKDEETTSHLFIHCETTQFIWKEILNSLNVTDAWKYSTLEDNLLQWFTQYPRMRHIPFLVIWGIWKYRNKILFENWQREDSRITTKIYA
jgi:hypothetical protein